MSDIKYAVWISTKAIPGTKAICNIINHFDNDAQAVYEAKKEDYLQIKGISEEFAEKLCEKKMDEALRLIDYCSRYRVKILPFDSPLYPKRLRRIPNFPVVLYYKGTMPDIDNEVVIAAVGTRKMSEYGQNNAYLISRDLARAGAIVVSGMASGIDSYCHRGALDALGHTIAVLGCGIDVVYPKSNVELMDEIIRTGTVMTEYPPGTEPAGYNFPKRNRIISGLSLGTFVVEADEKSGAMITATLALEQGREIFSLPGNVGEMNSIGTNILIKNGAKMITGAIDILDEYSLLFPQKIHTEKILFPPKTINIPAPSFRLSSKPTHIKDDRDKSMTTAEAKAARAEKNLKNPLSKQEISDLKLTPNEVAVLEVMPSGKGVTIDDIVKKGFPVPTVLVALTNLEVKRVIVALPGGTYIKNI